MCKGPAGEFAQHSPRTISKSAGWDQGAWEGGEQEVKGQTLQGFMGDWKDLGLHLDGMGNFGRVQAELHNLTWRMTHFYFFRNRVKKRRYQINKK